MYKDAEDTTRKMIVDPTLWPQPVLPMKHAKIFNAESLGVGLGIIFPNHPLTIFTNVNLFCIDVDTLANAKRVTFKNVDEMITAGWLVD